MRSEFITLDLKTHNCQSQPVSSEFAGEKEKANILKNGVAENVHGRLVNISCSPKWFTVMSHSMYVVIAVCQVSRITHQKTRSLS